MVHIYKTYSEEKQRTTPILSVDGKPMGFLSVADAIALTTNDLYSPLCGVVVNSAVFSDGSTIQRHFQFINWKKELFIVSWDGKKIDPTIRCGTHAAFNDLLAQYRHDSRWAEKTGVYRD